MENLNGLLDGTGIATSEKRIEHPKLELIRNQLFDVTFKPLSSPADGFDAPDNLIGLYKTTGGRCLGIAKDSYGILQPTMFFDTIATSLEKIGYNFDKSKIEYLPIKNSQVISFKVPLQTIKFKNAAKVGDITEIYALFTTSFDGSLATSLVIYSKRLLCSNGVLFATQKDMAFKFRHTPNMNARALTYTDAILKASQGITKYTELFKTLNKIEINSKQVDELLIDITGYDLKGEKELHAKQKTIIEGIRSAWELERNRTGNTAYGLYNAVTYFTNHDETGRVRPESHVMFGAGAGLNLKAEKTMMKLAMA